MRARLRMDTHLCTHTHTYSNKPIRYLIDEMLEFFGPPPFSRFSNKKVIIKKYLKLFENYKQLSL